jgi:signal peptidase I
MAEKVKKTKKKKSRLRENLEIVLWAILIALVIRIFFIEAYKIPTQSLYPNYLENDHLLVNKIVHGVRLPLIGAKLPAISQPKRGDIVVFQNPLYKSPGLHLEFLDLITFSIFSLDQHPQKNPKNFIKRCMGIPGDTIEWMEERQIKVNGKILTHTEHEVIDYREVDYGENVRPYKVYDLYTEKNGNKSYQVQYVNKEVLENYGNRILTKTNPKLYYIPKKGDILTITRKNPTSAQLIIKINNIDITHLWKTDKDNKTRGYNEVFKEETKDIDFINKRDLLEKTIDGKEFIYKIKHNYYFMIGDNRDNSEDGRFFGPVRENLIIGSPLFRYFPFNRFGFVG